MEDLCVSLVYFLFFPHDVNFYFDKIKTGFKDVAEWCISTVKRKRKSFAQLCKSLNFFLL